jgi:hypothetical protein
MPHVQLSVLVDHVTKTKFLDAASLEHVESCAHCRSDLRWLEQLENLRKFEPPKALVETVIKTFRKRKRNHAA